jgi:hypothetical protein
MGTVTAMRLREPARYGLACAYAALLVGVVLDELRHARAAPAGNDWVSFATGSHLLGTPGLYSASAQALTVHSVLHLHPGVFEAFVSPPIWAWLFRPFAALGPVNGITAFYMLAVACLAIASAIAARALEGELPNASRALVVLAAVWPLATLQNLVQPDAVVTPMLVLSWSLLRRGRPFAGGALLAVLVLKPQLVWLCVPLIVAAPSWRMLAGFGLGSGAILAASALVGGAGSVASWIVFAATAQAGRAVQYVGLPAFIAVVSASSAAAWVGAALLGAGATVLAIRVRDVLRAHPDALLALGLSLSLLCSPHLYPDDFVVLAPSLLWLAGRDVAAVCVLSAALSILTVSAEFVLPAAARVIPLCLVFLVVVIVREIERIARGDRRAGHPAMSLAAHA